VADPYVDAATGVVMTSTYDPAGNTKRIEAKAGTTVLASYSFAYCESSTADRDLRQSVADASTGTTG